MTWFLLCMIRYPEVQRRCHEERDLLLEEEKHWLSKQLILTKLPYTVGALYESLRISSVVGGSVPHFAREETSIAGYPVPKDAIVIANIR